MGWEKALESRKIKPGKKKMVSVKRHLVLIGRNPDNTLFATEALCRHMRWPLAWGAKVEDGCIRCPLHQTTHALDDGSLKEWSPFPLFPPYGKLVGKLSKQKNLKIFEVKEEENSIFVLL
jgi:nitrite reductase/ring-hydroxylating ferredoxin subunit